MILYYALTTYHILCCVLHKMKYKSDEKSVLLLSDIHQNSVAFINRYRESGVFDDVVIFPESAVNNDVRKRERNHISTKQNLRKAVQDVTKNLPLSVESFDEVYLCPDHFPFGWYVISKHIKYRCFEEGCGVLSNNEFMLSNMQRNKTQYALMDILGYFGSNKSCVEILADVDSQLPSYENPKMSDFSVKKIIQNLSESELNVLLRFFGVKGKVRENGKPLSLILTQHMANLGIMPLSDQHKLYTLFADYFLTDTQIIVKPHPDDIAGRYGELFGSDAVILPFAMPSELLAYCIEGNVKTAIAANSTAVKSLGKLCGRSICFDNRITETFRDIHRYYAAYMLINYIDHKGSIVTNGDNLLLSELAYNDGISLDVTYTEVLTLSDGITVISDNLSQEQSVENIYSFLTTSQNKGFAVFLNEKSLHSYFDGVHKEVFKYIRPVFIDRIECSGKTTEEVIYVYSKNKEVLEKAESFELRRELKYTGVTLDIHSISRDEGEKIKLLEGVLEATEKRLNEYIKNKKELDKKISELEKGRKK